MWLHGGAGSETTPDPHCSTGLSADYHNHGTITCCEKTCGVCGATSECQLPVKDGKACPCAGREGGAAGCCVGAIDGSKRMCAEYGPPCIVSYNHSKPHPPKDSSVCLYNLADDPGEHHNLAADPDQAERIAAFRARLAAIAATGPPLSIAFASDVGPKNKTATAIICAQEGATGFLLPLDWAQ